MAQLQTEPRLDPLTPGVTTKSAVKAVPPCLYVDIHDTCCSMAILIGARLASVAWSWCWHGGMTFSDAPP